MSFLGRFKRSTTSTKYILAAGAAVLAFSTTQAANAYEAYVNNPAPILTGPSPDYPPVVYLHGGETVEVYGCLDDYDWCDIQFRDFRGWFDASQMSFNYQGQSVPFDEYGYDVGFPVVTFSLGDYWGRYYRDRPFFRERDRWAHIQLPPPREHHFEGRPGFGGRPGFDRPGFDHGPGRPEGGPVQGRPDFNRPQAGRPEAGRPQFDQQRGAPQQEQERAQQMQHMQGTGEHQRYVGPGAAPQAAPQMRPQGGPQPQGRPQGGPAPQQPHPQAAPQAAHPQAAPAAQGAHPEHGGDHHDDNK